MTSERLATAASVSRACRRRSWRGVLFTVFSS
jgi:hypothetical protein